MSRRKREFWKPYCDDSQGTVTMWVNEGCTAMKAVDKYSLPKRLYEFSFPYGLTHDDYEVTQQTTGKGRNYSAKGKLEAELDVLKVVTREGHSGYYDVELVKKLEKADSKMYLGKQDGILFINNNDGSCGFLACCIPDKYEEVRA